MSEVSPNETKTRNARHNWAKPVDKMDVQDIPNEAINLNVQGRKPMSPLQGFGQMWQKTYRIRLAGCHYYTSSWLLRNGKPISQNFGPRAIIFMDRCKALNRAKSPCLI